MRVRCGLVAMVCAMAVVGVSGGVVDEASRSDPSEVVAGGRSVGATEPFSLEAAVGGGAETSTVSSATPRPRLRATTEPSSGVDDRLWQGVAQPVHVGSRRMTYEEVVAAAKADPRLEEYRQRRRRAERNVSGQLALAAWCGSRKLVDQQRVHLLAVVALDPENVVARRGLGHRLVEGVWIDPSVAAAGARAERRLGAVMKEHAGELRGLAARLGRGETLPEEAASRIEWLCDPIGITVMEACLSRANRASAACVVEALGRRGGRAVNDSLVRHALSSPWPEVRGAAIAELRSRDRRGWVPILLDAFEGELSSEVTWRQGPDGGLTGGIRMESENTQRRRVALFDHTVWVNGDPERSADEALLQAALFTLAASESCVVGNRRITAGNAAVASVLRAATDESIGDDPVPWHGWWSEVTGTPLTDSKPTETFRRSTWSSTRSAPAMTTILAERQRESYECLTAGTLVWTQSGPVEVDRIEPGDVVITHDPESATLGLRPVLATTVRPGGKTLSIRVEEGTVRCTADHPFHVARRGWTIAADLRPGDRLVALDGTAVIESIEESEAPVRSFNLVVAEDHTYFCGLAKVLSHDVTPQLPARIVGE